MRFPWDVPTVSVADLPADAVLLDVREQHEWDDGHIEGAVHVPMNDVPARVTYDPGALTPDAKIVVVCAMGGRSAQVTAWLLRQGFDATNLEGGMVAWTNAGKPVTAPS